VAVELKSHLPVERQARNIGAAWLEQLSRKGEAVFGQKLR